MDVSEILSELGENGFTDTGLTTKVAKIQAAIWEIEGHKPWPFLEKSIDLSFAGSSGVASNLPTDVRATIRLKDLVTGTRLMPLRLDDFEDAVGLNHSLAGNPTLYYFEGGQLKVWPLPAASTGRVKMRYVRWSAEITESSVESDILIPKQFHGSVIVPLALSKLYLQEDDAELSLAYKGLADEALVKMEAALFPQQFDRPDFVHVLDPDDYDDLYL
jgi:hypothetical protein